MNEMCDIGTNEAGREGEEMVAEAAEHLVSIDVNLFIAENIKPGRIHLASQVN